MSSGLNKAGRCPGPGAAVTLTDAMRREFNRYIECRRSIVSEGNRHAKILIPCDGLDNGLRVVRYAASLAIRLSDVQLELLNVQEPLPQRVHAALSEQVIARWQAGEADLVWSYQPHQNSEDDAAQILAQPNPLDPIAQQYQGGQFVTIDFTPFDQRSRSPIRPG